MKKSVVSIFAGMISAVIFASCASTTKVAEFPKMYEEDPVTIMIMPPINNSSLAEAVDCFYTTMNTPICEAGYYVLPPELTLATLEKENYNSRALLDGDLTEIGKRFGADVAVFTIIKSYKKLTYSVDIEVEYFFKSTKTNEVLYHHDINLSYAPGSSSGLIRAAIATSLIDHAIVITEANNEILSDLPAGKYRTEQHGADKEEKANFQKTSIYLAR